MTWATDRRLDISGQTFGRWTVLRRDLSISRRPHWVCHCRCGGEKVVDGRLLRSKKSKSCGCLQREVARDNGHRSATHGMRNTTEYRIWAGIRTRCLNPNDAALKNYGQRGIFICSRWDSFENFYADMGPRPSRKHTIERVENDGPYSRENCEWATYKKNIRNRRITIMVEYCGETLPLAELAERLGVKYPTMWKRYASGGKLDAPLRITR